LPESSAVKTVLTAETLVPVVEVELAVVVVGALVVAGLVAVVVGALVVGLVVVVVTLPAQPETNSRRARTDMSTRVFFIAQNLRRRQPRVWFLGAE
jgi:hypothetical protein